MEHGVSAPVIPVMPHAAVCASTASMSARIRHEWPDRLWTVRILRPRKGGIRTCFRSPTGRGNSLRNCPVRVRIPAKAPAEATASTPPDPVRTSAGTGTMLRQVLSITGIRNRCSARFRSYSCGYDVNAATRPLPYWGGVERWSRRRPAPQRPERNRLSSVVSATSLRLPKAGCVIRRNAGSNPAEARRARGAHATCQVPEWEQSAVEGMNRPQD